MNYIHILN